MSIRFGSFRLDEENACVWRGSEALHLTPKAFAVRGAGSWRSTPLSCSSPAKRWGRTPLSADARSMSCPVAPRTSRQLPRCWPSSSAYWPGCGSLVNRAGKATRLERHRRGKTWRGNYSWVSRRSQSTTAGESGVRLGPGWLRRAWRSGGQAGLPYDIHNGRNFPEQGFFAAFGAASPARSPARWAALSGRARF